MDVCLKVIEKTCTYYNCVRHLRTTTVGKSYLIIEKIIMTVKLMEMLILIKNLHLDMLNSSYVIPSSPPDEARGSGSLSGYSDLYQLFQDSEFWAMWTQRLSNGPGRTDRAKMSSHFSWGSHVGGGSLQSKSSKVNCIPKPGLPIKFRNICWVKDVSLKYSYPWVLISVQVWWVMICTTLLENVKCLWLIPWI